MNVLVNVNKHFLPPSSPVALQVPIRSQNQKAISPRHIHKRRRYGSIAGQHAILTYSILLEEPQRAIQKHDANELLPLNAPEISGTERKRRLLQVVLMQHVQL